MGQRLNKKLQIKNSNDCFGNGNVLVAKQKVPDTSIGYALPYISFQRTKLQKIPE